MNAKGREYPVTLGDQTEIRQPFYFPLRFLRFQYFLTAKIRKGKPLEGLLMRRDGDTEKGWRLVVGKRKAYVESEVYPTESRRPFYFHLRFLRFQYFLTAKIRKGKPLEGLWMGRGGDTEKGGRLVVRKRKAYVESEVYPTESRRPFYFHLRFLRFQYFLTAKIRKGKPLEGLLMRRDGDTEKGGRLVVGKRKTYVAQENHRIASPPPFSFPLHIFEAELLATRMPAGCRRSHARGSCGAS